MAAARRIALLLAAALFAGSAAAQDDFLISFRKLLFQARLADAEALAAARVSAQPEDPHALFALGGVQFLSAIEMLGNGLYRLGPADKGSDTLDLIMGAPLLRVPVPHNPNPEPMTPEALRDLLQRFEDRLAVAEATLARVPEGPVSLRVDLTSIRLDLDGNGKADESEGLMPILAAIAPMGELPSDLVIDFDESDVPWLRGYAHLLMGISDVLLTYDWSQAVDETFQNIFPSANLTSSPLRIEAENARATLQRILGEGGNCYVLDPWGYPKPKYDIVEEPERYAQFLECERAENIARYGGIGDLVAFVHLWRWPVIHPEKGASARQHLLAMIRLSRESWALIAAETDDDHEWIPGPKQTSPFARMLVNEAILADWNGFLDGFEKVLNGELLLPHWRFERSKGVNVRRMFDEPRDLDLVLLLTGSGALPYIETGTVAPATTAENASRLLSEGFLGYFFWFN